MAAPNGEPSSSGSRPELLADELLQRPLRVLEEAVGDRPGLVLPEPLGPVDGGHLGLLFLGHRLQFGPLERDLALEQLALALHRDVLAGGHAERAGEQARDSGEQDEVVRRRRLTRRADHAHHEREVADQSVADPEDDRPEGAGSAGSVPPFSSRDVALGLVVRILELLPDLGVLALVGGNRLDLGRCVLAFVDLLLVPLQGRDQIADRLCPEHAGEEDDHRHPRPGSGRGRRDVDTGLAQLRRPDLGVAPLVSRDPPERARPMSILLDRGQRVVEKDRVALEAQVGKALGCVEGHVDIVPALDSGR